MLDALIVATALAVTQGAYGTPSPPPMPDRDPPPTSAPAQTPQPQPSVPAVPGRTLADLPNTTITYFDVSGKDLKAVNTAIEQLQKPGADGRAAVAPSGWSAGARFNKATANGQCKVVNAKATFSAKVVLPRLVSESAHNPRFLADWRAYVAGVENSQAAELWFVHDRMSEIENAIMASSCDGAQAAGAAAVARLRAQAAATRPAPAK